MTFDLTTIVNLFALLCCAFLLVFWLVVSRKLMGFFYLLAGWVIIAVAVRSDHQFMHLAGVLVAAVVIVGLLVAGQAALFARRYAQSSWASRAATRPRETAMLQDQARCPECKRVDFVHEYAVSGGSHGSRIRRMCSDCATHKHAVFLNA